jgi:hypothetical protein
MKTEREQFLDDIVTTAVEGGIGYWSVARKYVWSDDGPTFAEISEEDAEGPWHCVDRATVRRGIARLLSGDASVHEGYVATLRRADRENDGGRIDAEIADMIVQAGVLGDVFYG